MGDFNVQIISARLKTPEDQTAEEFEAEIRSKLPLGDSAYHATAPFVSISHERSWGITLSAIVQAKYNRGMNEFLRWLEPFVTAGMGEGDAWAINFSEYSKEPVIRYLHPERNRYE